MNERAVRHIRSPCFGDIARLTLWLSFFNLAANYRLPESDFCCDSEALQRLLLLCHMQRPRAMSASLIGRLGSSAFRLSITTVSMSLTGSCFSSESAPGPFHHGIRRRGGTIFGAALPLDKRQVQADIRSHLIHRPARTSFHRSVDLSVLLSRLISRGLCHCNVPGPLELSAVYPDAVHDHGQPTGQRHDRLLHSAVPGDLHGPGLEPGPFGGAGQHALGRFIEHDPHHLVAAL